MKKVLEIINLPSSAMNFIGGQFKYLHEEGGYEMHLICSSGNGIEEFCHENCVKYYPVELSRQVSVRNDIVALWKIYKYLKNNRIDIVIAHQPKARLLGMIASVLAGVKHRVTFSHGILYETMTGLKRQLIIFFEKIVSMMSTKVVCVSRFVKDKRLEHHIDKPCKQVMLGRGSCNGIDTIRLFNPDLVENDVISTYRALYGLWKRDFVIGFCGRLVRDKGVIELVEAFRLLKEAHPDISIKLLVIGEKEKRDSLPEHTLQILTHSSDIVFTGIVPYQDIPMYYMLMNVLVLPTHREGFGMVAIEASAMERPVIVSNFTGCAETIKENITGLYIDKTPESIVRAIEKCFDENYARQLGINGRKFVCDNFEHTKIREHVLEILKQFE